MGTIVSPASGSLQDALDRAAESRVDEGRDFVRIELSDGVHSGAARSRLFYDSPVPLEIVGGGASRCVLRGENCEAWNRGTENRAVLTFGGSCTRVVLRGFSVENAHVKTADDAALGNQAEAVCWDNRGGFLLCERMAFRSRQDTLHLKGFSRFVGCDVFGDVDFIWGYCDTALFESCRITAIRDNRGGGRPAYVLQSRALNSRPGFVFSGCEFGAEERGEGAEIFVARSQGTGRADGEDRWDSVALVGCVISGRYSPALWTDEGGTRAVFPVKGSAMCGWREFGTKVRLADGSLVPYDGSAQERHGRSLSEGEARLLMERVRGSLPG